VAEDATTKPTGGVTRRGGAGRGLLALTRPANLPTAAADVAAGWCVAGATGWADLGLLAGASILLYAGGVTLNDVFDARRDATERPERPIPGGIVGRRLAGAFGGALLGVGVALGGLANATAGGVALGIVLAILVYNGAAKRTGLAGPPVMGLCRGLNLVLGIATSPAAAAVWWPLGFIPLAYIAGVTWLSRVETGGAARAPGMIALASLIVAVMATLAVAAASGRVSTVWTAVFLGGFALVVWSAIARVQRAPSPVDIQRAVGTAVVSIILLDASIAAGFAGPLAGLAVAALLALSLLLRGAFAVS